MALFMIGPIIAIAFVQIAVILFVALPLAIRTGCPMILLRA